MFQKLGKFFYFQGLLHKTGSCDVAVLSVLAPQCEDRRTAPPSQLVLTTGFEGHCMTVIFLPIIKTVLQSSASMARFMVTQLSAKQKISCLGQGLKERKTKKRYVCTENPRQQPDLSKQLGLKPGRTTAPCAAPEGTHQPAECRNFCYLWVHEEP